MFEPIARVLAFFYSLPVVGGSVGIAIILLTGAVMILLMPLTLRATRSTIKMQEVQPKLKELQKKHKDDKQTLNAELMALYQENGINPVGGCLPMLAQLPVFLVLFNVLRGLSRRVSEAPFFAVSEQARAQVGGPSIAGDTFDPRYLSFDSDLYVDLSQTTEMSFGPFDLAQQARDVIQNDVLAGIPYIILIAFVVATSFYQQRQVSSRRNGSIGMNPQQEMILKVLPLASGVWSFLFPAGLVLYWATSNVFRIGQQSYITRAYYGGKSDEADGTGDDTSTAAEGDDEDDRPDRPSKAAAKNPKSGSNKSGSNKSGSNKSGSNKSGSNKSGSNKSGSNKSGSNKDGAQKKATNGDPRKPSPASSGPSAANGDGREDGPKTSAERAEAWNKRRREQRARTQTAARKRTEQSSRITPKGTKPGSSKKKRKR